MVTETYAGFWWGNLKQRGQLQDLEVNERKINMDLQEIRWNGAVWIHLAQEPRFYKYGNASSGFNNFGNCLSKQKKSFLKITMHHV
jgi:hypothetical protein